MSTLDALQTSQRTGPSFCTRSVSNWYVVQKLSCRQCAWYILTTKLDMRLSQWFYAKRKIFSDTLRQRKQQASVFWQKYFSRYDVYRVATHLKRHGVLLSVSVKNAGNCDCLLKI